MEPNFSFYFLISKVSKISHVNRKWNLITFPSWIFHHFNFNNLVFVWFLSYNFNSVGICLPNTCCSGRWSIFWCFYFFYGALKQLEILSKILLFHLFALSFIIIFSTRDVLRNYSFSPHLYFSISIISYTSPSFLHSFIIVVVEQEVKRLLRLLQCTCCEDSNLRLLFSWVLTMLERIFLSSLFNYKTSHLVYNLSSFFIF